MGSIWIHGDTVVTACAAKGAETACLDSFVILVRGSDQGGLLPQTLNRIGPKDLGIYMTVQTRSETANSELPHPTRGASHSVDWHLSIDSLDTTGSRLALRRIRETWRRLMQ